MESMKMLREVICVFVFAGCGWAATSIQGTVKDSTSGAPLSGAVVRLVKSGYTSTTGADGKFSLVPTATVNGISMSGEAGTLVRAANGHALRLRNERTQNLRVSILTAQGQTVRVLHNGMVRAGEMTLATPALASGWYLVQLTSAAGSSSVPFLVNGASDVLVGAMRTPSSTGSLARMMAAAAFADTISVTAAGHRGKLVPVTDSVITSLTILLAATSTPTGMVLIPAKNKTWTMGAKSGEGYEDEYPAHQVTLTHDYYMDETEVTQGQYKAVFPGINPSSVKNDNNPVNNITWYDAVLYCNKKSKNEGRDTVYTYTGGTSTPSNRAYPNTQSNFVFDILTGLKIDYTKSGYRLPTEAEWEFAARGGVTDKYFFGGSNGATYPTGTLLTNQNKYAWNNGNAGNTVHPVKQKLANPYGLYDIYGNVWEWCNDWALKANGTENAQGGYTSANAGTDPVGELVETGSVKFYFKNFRGGDWSYGSNACNSTFRSGKGTPDFRYVIPGFRTVLRVQ